MFRLELVVYTSIPLVRTGILGYFRKAHRKMPKFPEGKELLLINMANTREIGTPQPQIPTEKQICANTSVYESEGWTVELMRMLYVNTAIPLSNLREAPLTCQHVGNATIPYCCLGHLWGTNGRPTRLSVSVSIK